MASRNRQNRRMFVVEGLEGRNAPSGFGLSHALAGHAHAHAHANAHRDHLPHRTAEIHKVETHTPDKADLNNPTTDPSSPDLNNTNNTTTDPSSPDLNNTNNTNNTTTDPSSPDLNNG